LGLLTKSEKERNVAPKRKKWSAEEAKAIDEIRRKFTAADLAKFAQPSKTVPIRSVIAELQAEHKQLTAKRAGKSAGRRTRKKSA
jgi:hypothetical protein